MENDCALSSPTPKRSSLKSQSHFNTYPLWKDKLRENCYKRVREDRNRLLWKMRLPTAKSLGDKDFIKSAFQDIVSDELKKITHSSGDDNSQIPTSGLDASDILWEYDGLHNAYQGECEEILLEMQRIFYEDLRAEPTRKEPENHIATWEDEEDEYLARAVYEHMHLNDKQVNLDILTTRLAEAHTEHLDRGCKLRPKFCIETRFGLTALYIHCEVCKIFEVVM
ncbi:uncharacterized protein LOC110627499 isoform X2 [Manihot esculenta]|uniref:RPA-interacting protein N-terminal domain-containing protein n=1 Tax=Manihot esculenta TaxID=3983 RepID=A0A2C9UU15_MANES|nr:uncharacterized protein LOC110627499 isoform X2 [Manihot esculenta]OAY34930.1 hypothetical protein MANES_12G058800v8 [Manihot esculenta]